MLSSKIVLSLNLVRFSKSVVVVHFLNRMQKREEKKDLEVEFQGPEINGVSLSKYFNMLV